MATEFWRFLQLPEEIQLMIWHLALLFPGVHFLKPFSNYNGTWLPPAVHNANALPWPQGPGVSEVSILSACCVHARICMVSRSARDAVQSLIRAGRLTRIILNPRMTPSLLNVNPGPNAVSALNRSHILVEMANDLFCVSSFRDLWMPNHHFTGGNIHLHPILSGVNILGIAMPPCNRRQNYFICRSCNMDHTQSPQLFQGSMEFCKTCMGSLIVDLLAVERVYLLVPGVRRAQAGDEQMVYRWGETSTIDAAIRALPAPPSFYYQLWQQPEPARAGRRSVTLGRCQTSEAVGPQGPQYFNGPGITLFDVSRRDVPNNAHEVLGVMFQMMCAMRQHKTATNHTYWPFPNNPSHCGGVVEFRFLSY